MEAEISGVVKTCSFCEEKFVATRPNKKFCSKRCQQNDWMRVQRAKNPGKYREHQRKHYYANREKRMAGSRVWKEANKECNAQTHREWCRNNKDKCREYGLKQYWADPEKSIAAAIQWAQKNKKRRAAYVRKHYEENKGRYVHYAKIRKKVVRQATPAWLTKEQTKEMADIYQTASQLGLQVDHIVPLQGKNVSGLHLPWNLRMIPGDVNRQKSNSHVP